MITDEFRTECLDLLDELEKWDVRPYSKDRRRIVNTIKQTTNSKRLHHMHEMLNSLLHEAVMRKLAENL